MQFQEAFPELTAKPPRVTGRTAMPVTKLENLRLQQLRDLARAYEIQIDMDAPKDRILPALAAAEASGTFNHPAKHELYLLKAARNADEEIVDHAPYDSSGTYPLKQKTPLAMAAKGPDEMSHAELQQACKQSGVNSFGMSAEQMRGELHGALGEG